MEQLYLFEILADKITFGNTVTEIPDKKDIKIAVNVSNLFNLEVESEDMRGFEVVKEPFRPVVQLDTGKSHLFPSKAHELYKTLTEFPLELVVGKKYDAMAFGQIVIPWTLEILQMVDKSRVNSTELTPVSTSGVYDITDQNQSIVGQLSAFVRLSCLGKNVQTQFQVIDGPAENQNTPKRYLFKSTNADTTFQARKYGADEGSDEVLPVGPIFRPADPKNFYKKGYISPDDMTADNLKKLLCKNKDCPGVQKFKEFGLGPAATGKGLGTVYGPADVPVSYGLSQTYGNLDNYGPYGIYTRPKKLDLPFIPKEPVSCFNSSGCEHCGGCDPKDNQNNDNSCDCCNNPLRLTGGAPIEDEVKFPEPMMMCKDLMQSFDKVLDAYKRALGPCGHGICPYAQNVVEESCKKLCHGSDTDTDTRMTMTPVEMRVAGASKGDLNLMSACGSPTCPHLRNVNTDTDKTFKNKQMRSACGNPACTYTKKRLGTANDDDMMELQFMGGKSCGTQECPYSPKIPLPPLEPIHWDCPDPLPKGPCRNPQCPLKPKELRYTPKGPCGNPDCPYAPPEFCGAPDCPFGPPQPCPFAMPPPCPFSPPPCPHSPCSPPPCPPPSCPPSPCPPPPCGYCPCPNPSCPSNPPTCGDPTCPLNFPPRPCPAMMPPCVRPCPPPVCPFSPKPSGGSSNVICENPECPYVTKKESPCYVPNNICSNPDCPFVTKKESPCYIPPNSQDLCENPQCPYHQNQAGSSNGICPNPECPYKKSRTADSGKVCPNPKCPYVTKQPSPCYMPPCPLPPCGYPPCMISPCGQPCAMEIGATHLTVEIADIEPSNMGRQKGKTSGGGEGNRDPDADDACAPKTCKAKGGKIECAECGDGENQNGYPNIEGGIQKRGSNQTSQSAPVISQQPQVKPLNKTSVSDKAISQKKGGKRRKRKTTYLYKLGDLYPGVHIGHRECIIPKRNVPAKMGWLWNVHVPCLSLRPRIGWRPGAVARSVAKTIISYRKKKGLQIREPLTPKTSKKKSRKNYSEYESDSDATVAPKPTLQIKKKEGSYFITMNPLKDPKTLEDNENPYMDCTPMQFKITKNKPQDENGCCCGDDDDTTSSDSELDIEFTPPAGVIRPERLKKKKNVVHIDTQYSPDDFSPPKDDKKGKGGGKGGKGGKGGGKGGKGGKGKGKKK